MEAKLGYDSNRFNLVLNPQNIDLPSLSKLLHSVGMRERLPDEMQRALSASTDVVVVYLDLDIVGFGRLIGDGVYYGSIWDVAVKPMLHGHGIGTMIMQALMNRAHEQGLYLIGLFTASHNRPFYEGLGFEYLEDVHAMRSVSQKYGLDH